MAPPTTRQFLLIDGDDTLWDNNVYFERAIEEFIDFLGHSKMTREQVRAALDEIERMNVPVHGYGSASFTKNLQQTYDFFFSSRRRHTRFDCDWSSDVCSSD